MQCRVASSAMWRGCIEHDATAEGRSDSSVSGEAAQDETITGQEGKAFAVVVYVNAEESAVAGLDWKGTYDRGASATFRGTREELDGDGVRE